MRLHRGGIEEIRAIFANATIKRDLAMNSHEFQKDLFVFVRANSWLKSSVSFDQLFRSTTNSGTNSRARLISESGNEQMARRATSARSAAVS